MEQNIEKNNNNACGLCIAAMVLGIVSIVLWCIWIISIPCGILALIFGIVGIKKSGKGFAITGLATGATTLAIWVLIFFFAILSEVIYY